MVLCRDIARILIYGNDASLLATRGKVLESAGFAITKVAETEDLRSALEQQEFDLALLCHTLNLVEIERTLFVSTGIQPKLKEAADGNSAD